MVNYRRNICLGGTYFFTANLANRKTSLLIQYIDFLKAAIKHIKKTHPFNMIAIVVLPEHLHTIWQLPDNDADYSLCWQKIKSYFTKSLKNRRETHKR